MKQEEIEKIKEIIGEAAFNEEYCFVFNSKNTKLGRPFAYIYPSKEFDYKLLGQFIVDAIMDKLAPQKINLNEVEKIVQICGNYMESYMKENKSDWVKGARFAIGYQLSDLQQAEGGEG